MKARIEAIIETLIRFKIFEGGGDNGDDINTIQNIVRAFHSK